MISTYIDESMQNTSETVMVEDGANCTFSVQTVTPFKNKDFIEAQVPILQVDYTIFHGDKESIEQNPIIVLSKQGNLQNTIDFRIFPQCYFTKLSDYIDNTTMYTGTAPANEAINWLMDSKRSNSQCSNPFFIERYALGVLGFSTENVKIDTTPLHSSERQCAWPVTLCRQGSVTSLSLVSTKELTLGGSIATEIGLLTNLQKLRLSKDHC